MSSSAPADGGQHNNRTLAFGPDCRLYVSVGSTCNACPESNPEHATLLRVDPSTGSRSVFARGLRNTIGFAWHPTTGHLWGMDHDSDSRGDDFPPEELGLIQEGADYGSPFCAGKQEVDAFISAEPPGELSRPDYRARTRPSTPEYQGHSAPMTLTFPPATRSCASASISRAARSASRTSSPAGCSTTARPTSAGSSVPPGPWMAPYSERLQVTSERNGPSAPHTCALACAGGPLCPPSPLHSKKTRGPTDGRPDTSRPTGLRLLTPRSPLRRSQPQTVSSMMRQTSYGSQLAAGRRSSK
ncbi:PQQ-dependent sugar dehydrogenase [Archangium violaceum]|nr:PQQ-dependent sugar dehydrogenase [Archangium violaceum]